MKNMEQAVKQAGDEVVIWVKQFISLRKTKWLWNILFLDHENLRFINSRSGMNNLHVVAPTIFLQTVAVFKMFLIGGSNR